MNNRKLGVYAIIEAELGKRIRLMQIHVNCIESYGGCVLIGFLFRLEIIALLACFYLNYCFRVNSLVEVNVSLS